ncbi:ATPase [Salmonella enterica subsp. enterica serovar Abaetetuba]|nr:ATPase [Salmonella enterica]EBP4090070.1 AAA family ATPase [Salmonella enterica subsp. enterica]EBV5804053.1 ATPase [Salmonella enterica subsp. enterica serovar Abaetetuba]ECI1616823.1 AAA family ATPase [Salmonella enterica subsp. enterica serovar Give]EDA1627782.1 AAA family ATPase [Salmonella enterica subsp. enterica serovar Saintpaul]EDL1780679.1 ATPase [Salmonella enterica subsp. enterica serovar Poona]EDV2766136.1 AAA family ATPase [Salmonella enterica subsp. enterica serovar Soahanin
MELITQLKDVMERRGYSQAQVARAIGRSGAVVNQFLQGKYTGDISDIQERITSFINREQEKEKNRRIQAHFVTTDMAAKGLEVLAYAHQECEICVLYGAAGLGKTMLLGEYAARNKDALFIEADPGYTARTLLEELCRLLGVKVRGNIHELIDACVRELRGSGRLLMVDEAELLPYRALEVLRRLHDKAGIGIVLAGMPRLLINLKGRRGEFAQLYSRVALALNLGDTLSRDDFNQIAVDMMPEASEADIGDALYTRSLGNARRLFKLARGVYRICDISQVPVSVGAIDKFAEMLIH